MSITDSASVYIVQYRSTMQAQQQDSAFMIRWSYNLESTSMSEIVLSAWAFEVCSHFAYYRVQSEARGVEDLECRSQIFMGVIRT